MTTQEIDDSPLRPTGYLERYNILRNHVKFYNNLQVAATYTVPSSPLKPWSFDRFQSLIYAALRETLNHQPIMGVTIEDEGSPEPKWIRLKEIDLGDVVKLIDVDPKLGILDWVRDAHRVPFDRLGELPLWRVVVANQEVAMVNEESDAFSFTVGFFCHHGIADGLSAGAFHLTFLDALNNLITNKIELPTESTKAAIIHVPKLPLVPTLEMTTPLPVGIFHALKVIVRTYIYAPVDPLNWSGPLISGERPRPPIINVQSFSLPPAIVSSLLSQCRREKTTITALVTILVARRLASMYPTHSRFTANVPFSMRKFTGHTQRDMGCYIASVEPLFSSETTPPNGYISCCASSSESGEEDERLWKSARETKKFIDDRAASPADQNVGMLKFVSDIPKLFYGQIGSKRAHSFEVTNIGVLDGGVGGTDKAYFDKVMFTSGLSTTGQPYCFCLSTAKNGYMCVSLCWDTGVVGDEEATGLVQWLEKALKGLAGM